MAPLIDRHLAQAGLADAVASLVLTLDNASIWTVMDPVVPLTNGMLLDLFRQAKHADARGRRLAQLLHGLGYIDFVDKEAEKKWDKVGSVLASKAAANSKSKMSKLLQTIRIDLATKTSETSCKPRTLPQLQHDLSPTDTSEVTLSHVPCLSLPHALSQLACSLSVIT